MTRALTDADVERFREQGFLAPVPALTASEAAALRGWVERIEREHPDDGWAFNFKANLVFETVDRLCRDARLLDPVEGLLGPDILVESSTFRIKEPGARTYFGWHQDDRFAQIDPHWVLVFLAVTECTVDNGCLQVIPLSHRGPMLPADRDPEDRGNALTRQPSIRNVDESSAMPLVLAPGEIGLFHSHLVHGSGPNRSADRRIGLIIDYLPAAGRQSAGRSSATLVRGEDHHGHFGAEPAPNGDLSEANVLARRAVLRSYPENLHVGPAAGREPSGFPDRPT